MARSNTQIITISLIISTLIICTSSQPSPSPMPTISTAPAPGPDCMTALLNMSDCLTYVLADSNLTQPDPGCCGELAGLVESNPVCLCQLLGNPEASGFDIDVHRAFNLPNACSVVTPSPTLCSAFGVPVSVPGGGEGPSHAPEYAPGSAPGSTPGADSRPGNGVSSIVAFNKTFFIGFIVAFVTVFF